MNQGKTPEVRQMSRFSMGLAVVMGAMAEATKRARLVSCILLDRVGLQGLFCQLGEVLTLLPGDLQRNQVRTLQPK